MIFSLCLSVIKIVNVSNAGEPTCEDLLDTCGGIVSEQVELNNKCEELITTHEEKEKEQTIIIEKLEKEVDSENTEKKVSQGLGGLIILLLIIL